MRRAMLTRSGVCAVVAAAAGVPLICVGTAGAKTLKVTTTTDPPGGHRCSLREAIVAVDAPGTRTRCGTAGHGSNTIVLRAGRYRLSVMPSGADDNTTGDLNVTRAARLTITGAGAGRHVIDAAGLGDRVLSIAAGAHVTLSRFTITGGRAPDGSAGARRDSQPELRCRWRRRPRQRRGQRRRNRQQRDAGPQHRCRDRQYRGRRRRRRSGGQRVRRRERRSGRQRRRHLQHRTADRDRLHRAGEHGRRRRHRRHGRQLRRDRWLGRRRRCRRSGRRDLQPGRAVGHHVVHLVGSRRGRRSRRAGRRRHLGTWACGRRWSGGLGRRTPVELGRTESRQHHAVRESRRRGRHRR